MRNRIFQKTKNELKRFANTIWQTLREIITYEYKDLLKMGMATRIYGCITESDYGLTNSEIQNQINNHNKNVIEKLPSKSEWPPLVKKMFSITDNSDFLNEGPNFAYGGRIIHFGANFKSVEYEWKEWKVKFENLLSELIWSHAEVHFVTEYTGVQTFQWSINFGKVNREKKTEIIKPFDKSLWEYEGDKTWDE
ncbi:hypothetical protein [Winogradskyella sp. Asnod2-B02-A]|uniref:hypothetical protein n=1 Tax=Winogradskyella sp. Asnod2-B02-A TaxID=3160583 RepID=UPI00386690C8